MKPYNERLPLIDAAIEELGGKWPVDSFDFENILHQLPDGEYVAWVYESATVKVICTRDEFNQRKAELQNKPSFSDHPDAKCFVQHDDGQWLKNVITSEVKPDDHGGWYWESEDLIDDSFSWADAGWVMLQKGKVIGNWQDTLEKRPEQKEQSMNNWYEKGELPPVGTKCEYRKDPDEWLVGEIFGHRSDSQGNLFAYINLNDGRNWDYSSQVDKFRPLRTETDKLVEQMKRDLSGEWGVSLQRANAICSNLIKKGYRKINPMSEDEFVKCTLKSFDTKRFEVSQLKLICESLRKLYRAGCRFLDQGE